MLDALVRNIARLPAICFDDTRPLQSTARYTGIALGECRKDSLAVERAITTAFLKGDAERPIGTGIDVLPCSREIGVRGACGCDDAGTICQ